MQADLLACAAGVPNCDDTSFFPITPAGFLVLVILGVILIGGWKLFRLGDGR